MSDAKQIRQFNKLVNAIGGNRDSPPDKADIHDIIFSDMMARMMQFANYNGLPESIPSKNLELLLQLNGYAFITMVNGKLYALSGGLSGENRSPYYEPTLITIANPALDNYNKTLRLGFDGVLIRNDSLMRGIGDITDLYAWYLTDAFLTLRLALINARSEYIINSPDDNSQQGASEFIRSIVDGELSFTKTIGFDEQLSLQTLPYSQHAMENIKSAIEAIQYLQGSWFRKMGLVQAYNMKREYVSAEETSMDSDSLDSLPIDMMRNRVEGFDDVNKMFGTNIDVHLGKAWASAMVKDNADEPKEEGGDEE